MIKLVLGYYDKKVGAYLPPTYSDVITIEDLIEQHRRMSLRDDFPVQFFDYDLYLLGHFDDKLGIFDLLPKADFILSMDDFRPRKEVAHG